MTSATSFAANAGEPVLNAQVAAEALSDCPALATSIAKRPTLSGQEVAQLASAISNGGVYLTAGPCTSHEAAAKLLQKYVGNPPNWDSSPSALAILARIYKEGRGLAADQERATQLFRVLWLRSPVLPRELAEWPKQEQDKFLSQPKVLSFLRDRTAKGDTSAKAKLVRALLIENTASYAPDEAFQLVDPKLLFVDPETALKLGRLWTRSKGAEDDARAELILRRTSGSASDRELALKELLRFGKARLLTARDEDQKAAAIRLIGAAAAFDRQAHIELKQALASSSVREFQEWPKNIPFRVPMTGDDYPSSAIREKIEGTVRLRLLFDWQGKLVTTEPLPGGMRIFDDMMQNIFLRRPVPTVQFGLNSGEYVWVLLPPIRFRLPDENPRHRNLPAI